MLKPEVRCGGSTQASPAKYPEPRTYAPQVHAREVDAADLEAQLTQRQASMDARYKIKEEELQDLRQAAMNRERQSAAAAAAVASSKAECAERLRQVSQLFGEQQLV